jgi:bifunctional non-homologous end joining protein LigD
VNHDQRVSVDGRQLTVRRLDKVLYPDTGTTKAEVLDYYARIAPVLLPLLANRPVTRLRWPDGTGAKPFFEKNVPSHAPDWLRTVVLASPGSTRDRETLTYPLIDDTAGLIWTGNLAALELHVPQWQVGPRGGAHDPDRLVIDLDPGAPAGLLECARVARIVAERLARDGLTAVPVTSGSKGMQLYVKIAGTQSAEAVNGWAKRLAESLATEHPDLIVSRMTKVLRPGKVLLDWSQNNAAKTTISPYSMRGRAQPWVAAPRTWDELDSSQLAQLTFTEVLARVTEDGDYAATLLEVGQPLPL